ICVKLKLHALEQYGMIDALGIALPAKLPVPKHELDALAFQTDSAVELIETLECLHGGARWTFRLGPRFPTRAPFSERRRPLFVGGKGYGDSVIFPAHVHLRPHANLAARVLPTLLQPVLQDFGWLRRIGEPRSTDRQQRSVAVIFVAL